MDFTESNLDRLMEICRIRCTQEERKELSLGIAKMLTYMDLLDELEIGSVQPCTEVLPELANVTREDLPGDLLSSKEMLSNAPQQIGGMVKIPPILTVAT